MNVIDNITDQSKQQSQVVLDDGSIMTLALYYNGATERWVLDVAHPDLVVSSINICAFPNLLRPWRNLVNFGLACVTTTGTDPTTVEDFVNGLASLVVLNAADVIATEEKLFGGLLQ